MKFFNWIRSKRNGTEAPIPPSKSYQIMHQSSKEEFSDWPNGLLAIGTFGTASLKQSEKVFNLDHSITEQEFEKELRQLLDSSRSVEELLDCLQEGEERESKESRDLQRSSSVVRRGRKDVRSDNQKRNIGKKSLSFLIKKALLCNGGFLSTPILKDPLPDPRLDRSRMEKILRAMLHKKIYPQRPSPKSGNPQKCLDMGEMDSDEEEANRKSKWVKTDSEYIVLEI